MEESKLVPRTATSVAIPLGFTPDHQKPENEPWPVPHLEDVLFEFPHALFTKDLVEVGESVINCFRTIDLLVQFGPFENALFKLVQPLDNAEWHTANRVRASLHGVASVVVRRYRITFAVEQLPGSNHVFTQRGLRVVSIVPLPYQNVPRVPASAPFPLK